MKLFLVLLLGIFCVQNSVESGPNRALLTTWYSSQVAGEGTIEAKMRDKGLYWIQVNREIERNSYVQDILEGRFGQPEGRGGIGLVRSLGVSDDGQPYAMVDFGRDYRVGIFLVELAPINFTRQPPLTTWYSSQIAAKGTLEAKMRDKGLIWIQVNREIKRNSYVQDILEGRLGQPEGRGAIGRVKSLGMADDGGPYAMVDFGRGYTARIFFSELSPIHFVVDPTSFESRSGFLRLWKTR